MEVQIIIPTKNEEKYFLNLLGCLKNQTLNAIKKQNLKWNF